MMVKVVKLFTVVLGKICSDSFIGKHLCRVSFSIKFHANRLKKDFWTGFFLYVLPNIPERFFQQNISL